MHDDHDQRLPGDLRRLGAPDRRRFLGWMAAAAALPSACASRDDSDVTTDTDATCAAIPQETAGPYPGDGSNGPDALELSEIVRRDLRSSIGGLTGTAEGVPLTIRLRLVDASGCAPLVGRAVYLWHCDRDGGYSMYTRTDQNWLRGVQVSDDDGWVEFLTVFPGCYPGRWPHAHFEVFPDVTAITSAANKLATSQLALPKASCDAAYEADGYAGSADHLASLSLATDGVFRDDGAAHQLAAVEGDVADGFVATLVVAV